MENQNSNPPPVKPSCGLSILRCLLICAVVLAMAVIGLGIAIMTVGAKFSQFVVTTHNQGEEIIIDGDKENRIALLALTKEIDGWGNAFIGDGSAHRLAQQLRYAADDPTVKAVLLEVDSPGGGLTVSDMLHDEIMKLQAKDKKIVALVDGMAASGGYYVIAPADYIVVQPTGMVGSFGVIMQHFEITELLQKIGVKVEPLKSTGSKDIGSIFRSMTADEREAFEKILKTYHELFIERIAEGRGLPRAAVAEMATGELFTSKEALDKKLIDEIGYFSDAANVAQKFAGENAEIFTYSEPFNFHELVKMISGKAAIAGISENFGTKLLFR